MGGASWDSDKKRGWNETGDPCHGAQPPSNVQCVGDAVSALFLGSLAGMNGTIPTEIGCLADLRTLDVRGNPRMEGVPPALSGTLPSQLGQLRQLAALMVFATRVSGTLPSELGRLRNVRLLDLGNNHFSGTIPSSFDTLLGVRSLYLNYNSLSGTVPLQSINPDQCWVRIHCLH